MVLLTLISAFIAFLGMLFLVRNTLDHAKTYPLGLPQRFHEGDVPRLGGVAMAGAVTIGWASSVLLQALGQPLNVPVGWPDVLTWIGVMTPTVVGGCIEDITQKLKVWWRLLLTTFSGFLAVYWMGLTVPRIGVEWIDTLWAAWPILGMLLAFIAVCGLPHAFNIIDGYNGLAGTVSLLICAALVHVALQVGDRHLAAMVLCLVGATAGFLVWNYPRGLIFAGDGGAYLWGVVISVACIALVQRNPAVSPWFPMLLLIYPVWETMFSIYRKLARGTDPSVADALHFHQLIYRRIVRRVFHDDHARRALMRNNRTSPYLWGFAILTVVPAVLFWTHTPLLMFFCFLFVVSYVAAYFAIIRFKVPGWLRH